MFFFSKNLYFSASIFSFYNLWLYLFRDIIYHSIKWKQLDIFIKFISLCVWNHYRHTMGDVVHTMYIEREREMNTRWNIVELINKYKKLLMKSYSCILKNNNNNWTIIKVFFILFYLLVSVWFSKKNLKN